MFVKGRIYKRSVIHDEYGGNRQSGICPSAQHPYIFIFSGTSGEAYGYEDRWVNDNVYSYSGEGQVGDMSFTKGNLRLQKHIGEGRRVFLFNYVSKGMVSFEDELIFIEADFFPSLDRLGKTRTGIKFFFKRVSSPKYQDLNTTQISSATQESQGSYASKPNKTERKGLVTSRVGQGAYRKSILYRWDFKCAVTGFNNPRVLIASHILPWKESSDLQKLDVDNGILLSPNYDGLFDRNLISFDESGNIMLSRELKSSNYNKLSITGKERIADFTDANQNYLEQHRKLLR